jgi:outer membrane protein OmpA-like peptidoglycan-associated protein
VTKNALRCLLLALIVGPLAIVAAPSDADAKLAFFRNYPDVKWHVIKTEHFNVFYPETKDPDSDHYVNGEFTARKTAYIAEEMYPLICGQFNYYLDETVNIVLPDQTDYLTGFTVPSWDWIVVSGHHSDLLWRLRGHHDWLRVVMYHEFAHVVSLKADHVFSEEAFGASVGARWNDGRINTSVTATAFVMKGDPWFWVEGGAEYYTQVAGINVWTSARDMRMRMDTLEDMLLNFDDMGDYFGSNGGFDGNRHYLAGYSFALYVEERFGEGVFQQFGVAREEEGWTPNFLTVIEDTLNISADELYDDWKVWAAAKYQKVRDEIMEDPAIGSRMALAHVYFETDEPDDLEQVAHVREDYKGADKYKWRRDREKDGMYVWGHRFSPDGSKWGKWREWRGIELTYATETDYEVFNPAAHPFVERDSIDMAQDGLLSHSLNINGRHPDQSFDFSPDGKKIVFVCEEDQPRTKAEAKHKVPGENSIDWDGWNWHQICVLDLEALEADAREMMIDHFGYDPEEKDRLEYEMVRRGIEPPEDKDKDKKGKKWAYRHWTDWVNANEVLVHEHLVIPGKKPEQRVSYPVWSPDGRTIAYAKYDDGNQNIWMLDLETNEAKAITNFDDGTRVEMLDWSPDATQVVAGLYRWNANDIYVFDTEGNGRPLTRDSYEDRDPHWAHDGNIYFTSDRVGGIFNVYKLNPRLDAGRLDRDLDGILDADDVCPDERETRNLYRDADGCPDSIPVRVTKERIVIDEKVFFELDAAVIKEESHELLDAVARVLNENPQLELIEVAGHTDSQGDGEYNLELSQSRSAAVLGYLVGKGVAEDRLTSVGHGQDVPLVEGDTEEAYATNRRVEFVIKQQSERTEIVEQDLTEGASEGFACGEGPDAELLEHAYLVQITNVVSGAYTPWLTPMGNLAYSRYTSWGWKDWGLPCNQFHNKVVDDTTLVIAEADYALDVPQEVYPDYAAITDPVPVHAAFWRNPIIIPIINIANVSLTHIGVDIGVYFSTGDVLDTNGIWAYAQAGEFMLLQAGYNNSRWWAEWYLVGVAGLIKFDYGFNLDDDGDLRTTDDQFLADLKQGYGFAGGGFGINLPIAPFMQIGINTFNYGRAVQGVDDGKRYVPLDFRNHNNLVFNLVSPRFGRYLEYGSPANPRGGRAFSFSWSPSYVVPLYESTGGVSVDDGQVFEKYFFNEFHIQFTEYIALPVKKPNGESAEHTLQINAEVGFIDRNVPYIDEIRGGSGGQVNRSNIFSSSTVFAGYGPYTLSGETSGIINLQYRFPIARQIDAKIGPLYIESIYMQFFGTVGNFWSYKLKDDAATADLYGERVLADEEGREGGGLDKAGTGVIREWPGMVATENGWPVLADAGVELRFSMNLFNRASWYSSVRVAYGFMGVSGRGDVDGDDVYTNSSDPTLDNRSDEREPAGFRFMIGIGSGW